MEKIMDEPNSFVKQETLDAFDQRLKTEKISPLENRVLELEKFVEYENFRNKITQIFREFMKTDDFRNKVKSVFGDLLKEENFQNKVKSMITPIISEKLKDSKIKWYHYIFLAIAGIVGSVITLLIQKWIGA